MFWIHKKNKKLKEKIKLLEEEIENLKEQLYTIEWGEELKYYKKCEYCGWKVVYTWREAHWIADIRCVKCWAKWFINLMFR